MKKKKVQLKDLLDAMLRFSIAAQRASNEAERAARNFSRASNRFASELASIKLSAEINKQ